MVIFAPSSGMPFFSVCRSAVQLSTSGVLYAIKIHPRGSTNTEYIKIALHSKTLSLPNGLSPSLLVRQHMYPNLFNVKCRHTQDVYVCVCALFVALCVCVCGDVRRKIWGDANTSCAALACDVECQPRNSRYSDGGADYHRDICTIDSLCSLPRVCSEYVCFQARVFDAAIMKPQQHTVGQGHDGISRISMR